MKKSAVSLTILLMVFTYKLLYSNNIIYVNYSSSGENTGVSWANAFVNLQSALDIANIGDQIWIAKGTYKPSKKIGGDSERNKAFQMKNEVAIYGGFAGSETSLDQRNWQSNVTILSGDIGIEGDTTDNCYHVVYNCNLLDSNSIIDGITIAYGNANGNNPDNKGGGILNWGDIKCLISNCNIIDNSSLSNGGGMYNSNCCCLISNTVFISNYSDYGGAIYLTNDTSKIENCEFKNNNARTGGCIYMTSNTLSQIDTCIFDKNSANNAGVIYTYLPNTYVKLLNCKFNNNIAYGSSGVIMTDWSSVDVYNSEFTNNESKSYGGAIQTSMSTPNVLNCKFINNKAVNGGAISLHYYSNINMINSTIVENYAVNTGGAFYSDGVCYGASIKNSIIWDNKADINANQIESLSPFALYNSNLPNRVGDNVGSITYSNCIYTDPQFIDMVNNDYRILGSSPCVDAGDSAFISEQYDIRGEGYPRKLDKYTGLPGQVDMGAYEYNPSKDSSGSLNVYSQEIDCQNLFVCPNPSNGIIELKTLLTPGYYFIKIVNSIGQEFSSVQREYSYDGQINKVLDLSGLNSGIYQVIIGNENHTISKNISLIK